MILKYLRPREWAMMALCVLLIFCMVYLELEIPDYMSSITVVIQTGGSVDLVVEDGMKMLLCALGSLGISLAVGFLAAWIAASLARRLRQLQFERVESFSSEEINRFSTASLITRSTNDITQIQMTVSMGMQVFIRAPIMAAWAIIKIADKNWEWTTATAVIVVILLTVISLLMIYVVPRFKKIQWLTDDLNRVTRENLSGIRVVRAYNAEDYQEGKFEGANSALTDVNLQANRAMAIMMPTMTAAMMFLSLIIYWLGAFIIEGAGAESKIGLFSDMVVFSSYAIQVVMSFVMLVVIFMVLPRAMVASRRVQEVIDTKPSIVSGKVTSTQEEGTVEFRDVSFKYPGASEPVISGISFRADKGETVAFIGSTGSGKTTLVNLIPRFFDVTSGQVLVDGTDVREFDLQSLRRKVAYVPQKAVMFSGTVDGNVRYGDTSGERTEEDVRRAIGIAQAGDFVSKMEGGLEGRVAQGGTNLSGGQKQRLSIARAVCRRPEIYIFDDSFSALDYRTDRELRDALSKETAGTTCLIVAQRISTIMNADRIIVLDDGRVAGIGTHEELLKGCQVYRDIAMSQFSEEELS